jgi:hypothetical protein
MSLCTAGRQPPFPPMAAFGPSARSANRPRLPAYHAPPRRSLPGGGRLASRRRHRRHPPSLPLWLTPAPKRWPRRSWPPSRRAPRPPGASLPSTYPHATAAIRSRRRDPHGIPNLSRLGGIQSPAHLPAAGGEGEGEEEEENGGARSSTARREAGAAREEEPDPREPSTPVTPASSASSSPRRVGAPTSRPRRVRVCARARAGHGARKRAPPHACAVALKARPGLWPLFRASAVLAAVHRTAAPQ